MGCLSMLIEDVFLVTNCPTNSFMSHYHFIIIRGAISNPFTYNSSRFFINSPQFYWTCNGLSVDDARRRCVSCTIVKNVPTNSFYVSLLFHYHLCCNCKPFYAQLFKSIFNLRSFINLLATILYWTCDRLSIVNCKFCLLYSASV